MPAVRHLDILPALEDDEVQQLFGWARDGPAVLVVMFHHQTVSFSLFLEALVVVDSIIGRVLDLILKVVLVHHLVKQCCGSFFNRTVKGG